MVAAQIKKVGVKGKDMEFWNYVEQFDYIGLTETRVRQIKDKVSKKVCMNSTVGKKEKKKRESFWRNSGRCEKRLGNSRGEQQDRGFGRTKDKNLERRVENLDSL
ncbi:hypothetical protein ANTPLA_LOCUS8879 [Anthophora plagiata]